MGFSRERKKLSKYRAEAIKNYLHKNGIAEDRVLADGLGATKMIYPEPKNQKEKEANRRVEVYILSSSADLASVLKAISE
jgi:outer membrane protein OmpA-like peptidoglycan-associated protein